MAHLTRIFLKMSQAQNYGPVLPDHIIRRYGVRKKLMGLKLNIDSSSFDNDSDEKKACIPISCNEKGDKESKNKFGRTEKFYPKLDAELCKDIHSVAGISLTSYGLGWSRINLTTKRLSDFGSVVISLKKYQNPCETNAIFKMAKAIQRMLPAADMYVFENYKSSRDRNDTLDLIKIQLISMLTVLLNMSVYDDKKMDKVFFQNCSVIDYLYELRIKGERISAGQKLQRILNDSVSMEKNPLSDEIVADLECIKLRMKLDFLNLIFSSQPLRRDASAIAFFLALSFIQLNKETLNI